MNFSSSLPAGLQGVSIGGTDLEVPPLLMLTASLGLPLAAVPNGVAIDIRQGQSSVLAVGSINQAASLGAITQDMVTLDRGVYRVTGFILAGFFGGGPVDSAADPTGARLMLRNPQSTQSQTIAWTGAKGNANYFPIPFGPFTFQLNQAGWTLALTTDHNTGVGQTIGVQANCYVEKLI